MLDTPGRRLVERELRLLVYQRDDDWRCVAGFWQGFCEEDVSERVDECFVLHALFLGVVQTRTALSPLEFGFAVKDRALFGERLAPQHLRHLCFG